MIAQAQDRTYTREMIQQEKYKDIDIHPPTSKSNEPTREQSRTHAHIQARTHMSDNMEAHTQAHARDGTQPQMLITEPKSTNNHQSNHKLHQRAQHQNKITNTQGAPVYFLLQVLMHFWVWVLDRLACVRLACVV